MEEELKVVENEDSLLNKSTMELQVKENEEGEKDGEVEKSQEEDPLDLSPENLQLAQKILGIDLILIKILENLPTESIVNFRLVNKTWEKEATKIIMNETILRFQFYRESKKVMNYWTRMNLSTFNERIRKSRQFPCSAFSFDHVPLKNATLKQFCTLHGSQVKWLHLSLRPEDAGKLGNFLLHQVPNVQELIIFGNDREMKNNPTRLFPENSVQVLAHLKSFYYRYFPLASEIIRVSPNLKRVGNQDSSLTGVDALASVNKIHLLKEVKITNDYEKLSLVELLAKSNTKIEQLDLDPHRQTSNEFLNRRFASALSKILVSSKETMTHVELYFDEAFFMGVRWPRLENVRELKLLSYTSYRENMNIPPNFITGVFPNIQKLESNGQNMLRLLNIETPLTHLEEFKTFSTANFNLDNFSAFAPNLTKLKLHCVEDFHRISNSLWTCSSLKQLYISMQPEWYSFPQLDMAFTGLSKRLVRKLHGNPDYFNKMKLNKKEIPRIRRSILNCPDLTALTIVFDKDASFHDKPFMTHVSGEFGFKMLENLLVEIRAPSYIIDRLDSLKPYVRLVTRDR